MTNKQKKIFTYIPCPKSLPGYLKLCLKTWNKYLPSNYEIITLSPQNIENYIEKTFITESILKKLPENSYLIQEYIAYAALYCNGGIFLEQDVIMTPNFSPPDILLSKYEMILYGNSKNDVCHGFIMAQKGAPVLEELLRRLAFSFYLPENYNYKSLTILRNLLKEDNSQKVIVLDCEDSGYLMEKSMYGVFNSYLYKKYYFSNICSQKEFFNTTKGLTALHKELTPEIYRKMNEKEFLNQDILLSNIFKTLL